MQVPTQCPGNRGAPTPRPPPNPCFTPAGRPVHGERSALASTHVRYRNPPGPRLPRSVRCRPARGVIGRGAQAPDGFRSHAATQAAAELLRAQREITDLRVKVAHTSGQLSEREDLQALLRSQLTDKDRLIRSLSETVSCLFIATTTSGTTS